jgi:uncharacterized protein (DUF2062 family)
LDKEFLKFNRQIKYYYLKVIRLRGEPHELALGMAFGIFSGMMPIIPFHMVLAITLALFFKTSKITAALGTWVSNPLSWYFLYYFNYKIGAWILGLSPTNEIFSSIMASIRHGEESMVIASKILGAGGTLIAAFLIGGFIMGFATAVPSYFVFLRVFQFIRRWREERRGHKYRRGIDR